MDEDIHPRELHEIRLRFYQAGLALLEHGQMGAYAFQEEIRRILFEGSRVEPDDRVA